MKLARPRAVLFDLDGTLIDSRGDIAAACNHALESVGRSRLPEDVIARFVGDGARVLVARALDREPEDELVDRALAAFHTFYEAHPIDRTTLLPGALEALDALAGLSIGLVTNKPRGSTLAVLGALGILPRFAIVRTGSDGALKPDPHAVLSALEALRVPAVGAWMVGDADQDVLAGRAAGCFTVVVRGGFQARERVEASAPDVFIESLRELPAMLANAL